jgi:uncharacterized protein (DUF433 family)
MPRNKAPDRREISRYGIKEAARCFGMSVATLDSWVNGRTYPTSNGEKFFPPLVPITTPGMLSFYNLVETHILLSTRRKYLVEMPAIRSAINYVKRFYPSPHPLLSENFLTDGKDLFVKKIEGKDKEQTVNISRWGQFGFAPVLDLYLQRIERDEKGLPAKLFPIRMNWEGKFEAEPPRVVVIDPAISSGRPVVAGTGIMADVIVGRFNAGEGMESLADDYNLVIAQIEEVIRYAPAA